MLLPVLVAGIRNPIVFFYFAIASTAFLKTPELPIVREKLALPEFGFLLTWLFWANIPKHRIAHPSLGPMMQVGSVFALVCFISSCIGVMGTDSRGLPLSSKLVSYSFLETLNYIYALGIVWTAINLLDSWPRWLNAVLAWIVGMAVASLVGAAAVAGMAPAFAYEDTGRICSTLRNENQVPSMILPIILAVFLGSVRKGLPGWVRLIFFALAAAALVTAIGTGSRTALLMIILSGAGLYLIVGSSSDAGQSINLPMVSSLAILFTVAIIFYFSLAWSMYDGNYSLVRTPSWQRPAVLFIEWYQGKKEFDSTRPLQIAAAVEYFWNSPLIGAGPKLGAIFASTHGEVHNTYFSLLLETGVLGLGCFLALKFNAATTALRLSKTCPYRWYAILARCLLVGLITLTLYNNTMLGLRQRNIWILLGMLFAFGDLAQSSSPEATQDPIDGAGLPRWLYGFYRGN